MDDASVRRHHTKILKSSLSPAQERIALLIALELEQRIGLEGGRGGVVMPLDRVIDHPIDGDQRSSKRRIGAQIAKCIAHRGKIHYTRDSSEVLKQNTGRSKVDLARRFGSSPFRDVLDITGFDSTPILTTEQ